MLDRLASGGRQFGDALPYDGRVDLAFELQRPGVPFVEHQRFETRLVRLLEMAVEELRPGTREGRLNLLRAPAADLRPP